MNLTLNPRRRKVTAPAVVLCECAYAPTPHHPEWCEAKLAEVDGSKWIRFEARTFDQWAAEIGNSWDDPRSGV